MKVITYSKNVFIPITTVCNNNCSYCHFKEPISEAKITSLSMIEEILKQAKEVGCKEVLFTCGSQPDRVEGFKEKLENKTGFESSIDLLLAACQKSLEVGILPHSNSGVISKSELEQLAQYNASLGLMLETTAEVEAHQYSPSKNPVVREDLIAKAGQLQIPFTSGLLLGIGESREDRIESLKTLAKLQDSYGHLQEVIIQSVDPPLGSNLAIPEVEVVIDTLKLARQILPKEVALQVPPNLIDLNKVDHYLVDDLGGISSLTIDYINPDHAWPKIKELKEEFSEIKFKERLPVYPQYLNRKWISDPVWNCLQSEGWIDEFKTRTGTN